MKTFRIIWSILLILAGLYVFYKINDTSDPSSFKSRTQELNEILNENP